MSHVTHVNKLCLYYESAHDSVICVTRPSHMCDTTQSCHRCIRVTWLSMAGARNENTFCNKTSYHVLHESSCVCRDAFICVKWISHGGSQKREHILQQTLFQCVPWLIMCVPGRIQMCEMNQRWREAEMRTHSATTPHSICSMTHHVCAVTHSCVCDQSTGGGDLTWKQSRLPKFQTSLHWVPVTFQQVFTEFPRKFEYLFTGVNGGPGVPRLPKRVDRKTIHSWDPNILSLVSSMSGMTAARSIAEPQHMCSI